MQHWLCVRITYSPFFPFIHLFSIHFFLLLIRTWRKPENLVTTIKNCSLGETFLPPGNFPEVNFYFFPREISGVQFCDKRNFYFLRRKYNPVLFRGVLFPGNSWSGDNIYEEIQYSCFCLKFQKSFWLKTAVLYKRRGSRGFDSRRGQFFLIEDPKWSDWRGGVAGSIPDELRKKKYFGTVQPVQLVFVHLLFSPHFLCS